MFDTKAEFELRMRLSSGANSVLVRWPTDEEWQARNHHSRRLRSKRLGRGATQTIPPEATEADLKLYQKIALNGTPTVTEREAFQINETLASCLAVEVQVEGDQATVELSTTMGGNVKHVLRVPTVDQVVATKAAGMRLIDHAFGQMEIRLQTEPGARLWDACGGKSGDYVGDVPAIHKDVATKALMEYLDQMLAPQGDDF